MDTPVIVIVGAGRIGRALDTIFKHKSLTPAVLDAEINQPEQKAAASAVIQSARIIFLCTPSTAIRQFLESYGGHISPGTRVVILSKGLDSETGSTLDKLVTELAPQATPILLYGPMLSDEIMAGKGGCGVCASEDTQATEDVSALFKDSPISVEQSADVRGVALAGVLKNVYAVVLGLAQGLNWGDNRLGTLVARSAVEMEKFIETEGGTKESALGRAGLADLLATGYGAYSKNRRTGMALARGEALPEGSEGLWSIEIIGKKIPTALQLPIFQAITQVLDKNLKPEEALGQVMR